MSFYRFRYKDGYSPSQIQLQSRETSRFLVAFMLTVPSITDSIRFLKLVLLYETIKHTK